MNMMSLNLGSLVPTIFILLLCGIDAAENKKQKPICSWKTSVKIDSKCPTTEQFQCLNTKKCIDGGWYCDNGNDCGDNSDEMYCSTNNPCPTDPLFIRCEGSPKCIPFYWICNGHINCPNSDDERNCRKSKFGIFHNRTSILGEEFKRLVAANNVLKWLHKQKKSSYSEKWGAVVDKLALILYLGNESFNALRQNETIISEMAYELNIQLLLKLTRMKIKDIPTVELASYINAFLVMCINPRDFYGYDIVQELRNVVDKENYTNPYVLLALCNAGETITEADKKKLMDIFSSTHRVFWTDMQAVVVMALACASKQPGNNVDPKVLEEMVLELKQHQYRNGTVINLSTTALVLQALISTESERDPDNFDEVKAFGEILRNQELDGSFGDLMNTLLVTPVLGCRSLVDINANHCQYGTRDEISALENLSMRSGSKKRVQYSLWINNEKNLERNLVLLVPQNMSLYGVMEIAAEIDSRFKFEYSVKDRKPYISAISGMRDSPLTGNFWFLYIVENGEPILSNKSPADIIPTDNGHYIMWYRKGFWVD